MTNDKQVEVWRKQFEQWYRAIYMNSPIERDSDSYIHVHAAAQWGTWLAAKRFMQPIELPKPTEQQIYQWFQESTIEHHIEEDGAHIKKRAAFLAQKAIQFAITAAGYNYRVKS